MQTTHRKFVVYAPPFDHKFAGIVMLYLLNDSLNALGETSKILLYGSSLDPEDQDAIVVYPEVVHNNPLGAKHVARYLLNKDGLIQGEKIDRSFKQFIFTYSRAFDEQAPVLFFPNFDTEILNFTDNIEERELHSMYFGKGPPLPAKFDGSQPHLLITRSWPKDREQLLAFLKMSRFVHLSDSNTALSVEALLCGCIPLIHVWDSNFSTRDYECAELNEVFRISVEQDFSTANILSKIESARQKIIHYQSEWPTHLRLFVQDVQQFFQ